MHNPCTAHSPVYLVVEVVNSDETAGHSVPGPHEEVERGLGVVTTRAAGAVRVDGFKGRGTAGLLEVKLAPRHKSYTKSLQVTGMVCSFREGIAIWWLTAVLVG